MFRLLIASGADFADYQLFEERLDYYLQSKSGIELVTGFCKASDQLAELYAAAKGYALKPFPGGFKGMPGMLKYSDAAVVFWDGHSSGAGKLIKEATIPVKVVKYSPHIKIGDDILRLPTPKKKAAPKAPVDPAWKIPYRQAHEENFAREFPAAYRDLHYTPPKYPDARTTNGITMIIIEFLKWKGHYSNRQNVIGRQIGKITKTDSGATFDDRKWIRASTRKGASDIIASIGGKFISIEIKNTITRDTIKDNQIKERKRVEKSGSVYVVITSVAEFFSWYDNYIATNFQQADLF